MLKTEPTGGSDWINVGGRGGGHSERNQEGKKMTPKLLVLNNWKDRVAINWDRQDSG